MAGIYIHGMKMPEGNEVVYIFSDGTAQKRVLAMREVLEASKTTAVPDHGDLIDRDEQFKRLQKLNLSDSGMRLIETVLSTSDVVLTADKI